MRLLNRRFTHIENKVTKLWFLPRVLILKLGIILCFVPMYFSWASGVSKTPSPGAPTSVSPNSSQSVLSSEKDCSIYYAEIIPLKAPDFNQMALWKKTWGIQGIDYPRALLRVVDGGVIIVGYNVQYAEKTGFGSIHGFISRYSAAGDEMVDRQYTREGLTEVVDALVKKTHVVVLESLEIPKVAQTSKTKNVTNQALVQTEKSIGLALFNGAGDARQHFIIRDAEYDLVPKAFAARESKSAQSEGGYVILAEVTSKRKKVYMPATTALLWVSESGVIERRRLYLPGTKTQSAALARGPQGEWVIAGRIQDEHNHQAGWLMGVDNEGRIVFQRPYTRGTGATLRAVNVLPDGSIIAVGDSLPLTNGESSLNGVGDKAGWIMKLSREGTPIWQKYLSGKYSYTAADVRFKNGVIWGLWAGNPTHYGGRKFARLIGVTSEGKLISDDAFVEESNALPWQLDVTNDYMAVLGIAETGFSEKKWDDRRAYVTYDNWLMALPFPSTTPDQCTSTDNRTIDDLP